MYRIKDILKLDGRRAALLCTEHNIRYLIGIKAEGWLLSTTEETIYYTDGRYELDALKALEGSGVKLVVFNTEPFKEIASALNNTDIETLLCEKEMPFGEAAYLAELIPMIRIKPMKDELDILRSVKSSEETALIERAQRIAEAAYDDTLKEIRPGTTEREIKAALEYNMLRRGSQGPAFDTIVASGPNGASPHAQTTDRTIAEGDFIVMDFGASVNGYFSDMTRTLAVGKVDTEQKRIYNIILKSQIIAIDLLKAGITGAEADAEARKYIDSFGYGENFNHSLGHGVGLMIHELPRLSRTYKKPLVAGQVVTVEPGVYFPGKFGIRIEDMCLITEDGNINLTKADKSLIIL